MKDIMNMLKVILFLYISLSLSSFGQNIDDLELMDPTDADYLLEDTTVPETKQKSIDKGQVVNLSDLEEVDDLKSLKDDIGEISYENEEKVKAVAKEKKQDVKGSESRNVKVDKKARVNNEEIVQVKKELPHVFEVGQAEKELLAMSIFVQDKIPSSEWDEISTAAKVDQYVVQEGDWLWKISQRLFGSGFYYSKIWSLNPHITNPHEIEPGMTLVFSTGSSDEMPSVQVGSFDETDDFDSKGGQISKRDYFDYSSYGDDVKPPWIDERKKLIDSGIYFQYASIENYDDLVGIGMASLNNEHEKYEPPVSDFIIKEPDEAYDNSGFDKSSKITFDFKEGFFLNTFITSNIVQDLGEIVGAQSENIIFQIHQKIYVKFDKTVKVKPGDKFSVYVPGGKISHKISDRTGYKYTIGGQIKTLHKINHLWECEITEITGMIRRKDRITVYTPKIAKIVQTFNKRNIEAAIIGNFEDNSSVSYGTVAYIDRGRADGVEMGTVFELFSFKDRGTEKRLTRDPTYKIGEVTVISLTDNFATVLATNVSEVIRTGVIGLSKTEEQALLAQSLKKRKALVGIDKLEKDSLEELDIELNLDDISKDLLDKADRIKLTEDELEELERQEREHSVIKDHEKDLQALEKLEDEIIEAEAALKEGKLDEDKYLEAQNLNEIEKKTKGQDPNAFESLNSIEKEVGLKFLDQDLNSKENPYGLTEFDLEEIDELLNTEKL